MYGALALSRKRLHQRRLNDGDKRHVGICRDGDGSEKGRCEYLCNEDRGRTVRTADDADSGGSLGREAECERAGECRENAELSCCAKQEALRVCDQRTEIGHCADTHKDYRRVDSELDSEIYQIEQSSVMQHRSEVDRISEKELGMEQVGTRQVCKQHAECYRQQQQRLELLDNGEIEEHADYHPHGDILPCGRVTDHHLTDAGGI